MESSFQAPEQSINLLDDEGVTLYQASQGKRFLNYLIDQIVFYVLWKVFLATVGKFVIMLLVSTADTMTVIYIKIYVLVIFFLVILMTLQEALTGGKTIGKLITRTRAVNQDGTRITAKTALLRSLARCVPFDPFSALGSPCFPWHDKWTKTFVIDERESTLPV
jgi:uncharacterized RDD family membrane protein YckC